MKSAAVTIAAVATPSGKGGIAVVRVSGPAALAVARNVCDHDGLRGEVVSHYALVGLIRHPEGGEAVDQAVVLPMIAPGSYTGEDVVEISCHGGEQTARLVLDACLSAGAAMAGPGEFTRRAFLNGRLSLDQAEAVADLIHADDALSARAALAQLRGGLRRELAAVETPLLELHAQLEGSLEFGDEDDVGPDSASMMEVFASSLESVDTLLADARGGRLIRDGVQVVLMGPPNAGKSSLFNALLGEQRALVDHEAGTTRDVVSSRLSIEGVTFVLHDTAGLRDDGDRVESAGVALTRREAARADLVLQIQPLDGAPTVFEDCCAAVLRVGSRADLASDMTLYDGLDVATSARTGEGLDELRRLMTAAVDAGRMNEVARAGRALSQRHRERLEAARSDLVLLREQAGAHTAVEVLASLLSGVLAQLGEVTGRVYSERLLGEVFSRFCVGK